MQTPRHSITPKSTSIPPPQLSIASYLNIMLSIRSYKHALNIFKRELNTVSQKEDDHGVAKILLAIGCCYLMMGKYKRSIDYHIRSLDAFKDLKDINGAILSTIGIAQTHNFMSDYFHVDLMNTRLYEMMIQTRDPLAKLMIRLSLAEYDIMMGKHAEAEIQIRKIHDASFEKELWYPYAISKTLLGYLRLEKGDADGAIPLLEKARELIEDYHMPLQFTYYIYYILPEAYWLNFLLNQNTLAPPTKKASLDNLRELCNIALSKTRTCAAHYGGALRIAAKYQALIGRKDEAEKLFLMSIGHCSRYGRRLELGISFYFFALFLRQIGRGKEAILKLKSAHRVFKEIGSSVYLKRTADLLNIEDDDFPLEVIHRKKTLATIIEISQTLNTIRVLEELSEKILLAAMALTGAERGCLFLHNEKAKPELKAAKHISTGKADTIALKYAKQNSEHPSVLCAPIKIGDRDIGFCYLDKQQPDIPFDEHDAYNLLLFMSQVAVPIENCLLTRMLGRKRANGPYPISPPTEKKLKRALAHIRENFTTNISREDLAEQLDMNPDNLGRFFKQYTGNKISEYTHRLRIEDAARKLKESDLKIIDIAFSVGFGSLTTFNRVFYRVLRTTPSRYRSQHQP